MIALAELHNLIKSLNKPEKRFFKLLSATEKGKVDKAIALFDFIEKSDESEDIYYKTDKDNKVDVSLNNLELLYNLILKSQRNFYSEAITAFSLNDELSNIKILFEKAQYKQCRKMVKPLKERALVNEKFNYLLEILELEKNLLKAEAYNINYAEGYDSLLKQQDKFTQQEKNVGDYYQLYARLKYQIKNNILNGKKKSSSFYEDFLKLPDIKDLKKAHSKKARLILLKCRALCYTALKNYDARCKQLLELKYFVSENEFLFDEMPRHYIDILYNLANCYIEMNQPAKVKAILAEMLAIINSRKIIGIDLTIKLRSYAFNIELLILTYTAKYKEAFDLSLTINQFIAVNDKIFNKEDKSVLLFNLTNFYIYNYNYAHAEKTLEKLLLESDKKGRWDLKCYSRIQQLILCFELKQYSKLPLINDILKNLVKENVFTNPGEIRSIEFFDEIVTDGIRDVPEKQFKILNNELRSLMGNKEENWSNFFYFNLFAYSAYKSGAGEIKDIIHKNFILNAAV